MTSEARLFRTDLGGDYRVLSKVQIRSKAQRWWKATFNEDVEIRIRSRLGVTYYVEFYRIIGTRCGKAKFDGLTGECIVWSRGKRQI